MPTPVRTASSRCRTADQQASAMTPPREPADGRPPTVHRPAAARQLRDEHGNDVGWTIIDLHSRPARAEPLVRSPGVDASDLARVAAAALAGMRVATDDKELAHALVDAGGSLARHATVMVAHPREPVPAVQPPSGPYEIVPLDSLQTTPEALAIALSRSRLAAYGPSHPDHDPAADAAATTVELRAMLSGELLGPVHPALSVLVRESGGRSFVGGIIVTTPAADAIWPGGPWITDLFVHPRDTGQGLGRRLLRHTLSAAHHLSLPRVGLAVTRTNPAADLYRSMGFTDLLNSWAINIPETARRTDPCRGSRR